MAAGAPPQWQLGMPRSAWTRQSLLADQADVAHPGFVAHRLVEAGQDNAPVSYRFYGNLYQADVIILGYQWGGGDSVETVPQGGYWTVPAAEGDLAPHEAWVRESNPATWPAFVSGRLALVHWVPYHSGGQHERSWVKRYANYAPFPSVQEVLDYLGTRIMGTNPPILVMPRFGQSPGSWYRVWEAQTIVQQVMGSPQLQHLIVRSRSAYKLLSSISRGSIRAQDQQAVIPRLAAVGLQVKP